MRADWGTNDSISSAALRAAATARGGRIRAASCLPVSRSSPLRAKPEAKSHAKLLSTL